MLGLIIQMYLSIKLPQCRLFKSKSQVWTP